MGSRHNVADPDVDCASARDGELWDIEVVGSVHPRALLLGAGLQQARGQKTRELNAKYERSPEPTGDRDDLNFYSETQNLLKTCFHRLKHVRDFV